MSDAPPCITIATVCRNDVTALRRTCASIAIQTSTRDIEHLVVDGASTDGTVAWYLAAPPVAQSRIVSERDGGIYDAMNKAIALARGEYVIFLNAGDELADSLVLERNLARIRRERPRWAYGRARVVDEMKNDVRAPVGMVPYSRSKHLYYISTICHQAVIMQRSLLQELDGFDERFGLTADYDLLLRAGLVVIPSAWRDIDVLYDANGVSAANVFTRLWSRHHVRVQAMGHGRFASALDSVFTTVQTANVRARKLVKPALLRANLLRR
jgi:glycosyltransferase involved in cell wall biosynthesis